ncbi:MAG: protein kinase [Nannocystaceae bacterium]|nr:protein kinase [Nannocystaceae bacterium]
MSAPSSDDSRTDLLTTSETSLSFGKYRLTRLLARGGMGEVYLARLVGELGFEKRLVIKTILPELAAKPRFVEMFAAEAKTAVALSHGNIVPIYELGRAGETFYIVMGHVDGPSLATVLDRCRHEDRALELGAALHILRGVLAGLAYAHTPEPGRPAVVHRDITPRNVLVDRSGQVRIVDFGIAAPADAEVDMRGGSTGYAAPEQMRGGTVDPRADVFSAACLLYELVTLERAFPKEGVYSLPPLDVLPGELREPIADALALEADRRPADAGALLARLGPALARHAASYGDQQLAAQLRALFPGGWDTGSQPAIAGTTAGAKKPDRVKPTTQTFATRLTVVTRAVPIEAAAAVPTATAAPRRWLPMALLGGAVAVALGWVALSPSPAPAESVPASPLPVAEPTPAATAPTRASPAAAPPRSDPTPPQPTPPATPTPPTTATVALAVVPDDATVTVDGVVVADKTAIAIPTAGATVVVRKPGFLSRSFQVDAQHPLPATVTLRANKPAGEGTLQVFASGVAWAEVSVDGRKLERPTPIKKLVLPEGQHRVVVTCTDACPSRQVLLQRTVTIRAGETLKLTAE